jgi:ribosomal-protein-alanine N-acetyltransferase
MQTVHLTPRPFSGDDLLAIIAGVEEGRRQIGLPLADGLREFYVSGEVSPAWLEQLREAREADPWVHGFALVENGSGAIVGTAGFKGPPDAAGVVEIAYAIVADRRGRGYATETAEALVRFGFAAEAVRVVRAHTLPAESASTRVLGKCGFIRRGEVMDPEDGRGNGRHLWRVLQSTKRPYLTRCRRAPRYDSKASGATRTAFRMRMCARVPRAQSL